jgi:hypothetical protein
VHTRGRVLAVAVNHVNINYPGAGVARFDGQITVESLPAPPEDKHVRFSRPGDSGSLIVDLSGKSGKCWHHDR